MKWKEREREQERERTRRRALSTDTQVIDRYQNNIIAAQKSTKTNYIVVTKKHSSLSTNKADVPKKMQ